MNRTEFLKELESYGVYIRVFIKSGTSESFLILNDRYRISSEYYEFFGYYCGGTYNPVWTSNKTEFNNDDIKLAIKNSINIIDDEYDSAHNKPTYYTCKEFLNNNFGKTKVEKQAIDRVFNLLKENYQDLWKYTKSEYKKTLEDIK